jgi:hypothetical protein
MPLLETGNNPRSCFSANNGTSRGTKFDPRQLRGKWIKDFY